MSSTNKESAPLLCCHLLHDTNVVEGMNVFTSSKEQFAVVGSSLDVQILHQIENGLRGLLAPQEHALLEILVKLWFLCLQDLSSLVGLCRSLCNSERFSLDSQVSCCLNCCRSGFSLSLHSLIGKCFLGPFATVGLSQFECFLWHVKLCIK